MAFPVTINGRTYTLADFSGQNYVTGFPDALQDFVTEAGQTITDAEAAQTAAETAQTGAEAAQTAAEAAQAAAEAAQEAIDGLYLGAQASNPTVDLNGDPLTAGDWYFNTTDNNSRVYDGSSWNIIDPDLSGDASPTLGGDLDGSGYNISGVGDLTMSGDLSVGGGSGATAVTATIGGGVTAGLTTLARAEFDIANNETLFVGESTAGVAQDHDVKVYGNVKTIVSGGLPGPGQTASMDLNYDGLYPNGSATYRLEFDTSANQWHTPGGFVIDGSVGIGQSGTLNGKLHLDGGTTDIPFYFDSNTQAYPASGFGGALTYNHTAGSARVNFWNTWSGATGSQGGFDFRRLTGASSSDSLMTINGDGNVGIGTSNPSSRAEIYGLQTTSGNRTSPYQVLTITANYAGGDGQPYYTTSTDTGFGGGIVFKNESYDASFNDSAAIYSSIGDNSIDADGGRLGFYTSATRGGSLINRMQIDFNGHIGFGVLDPSEHSNNGGVTVAASNATGAEFVAFRDDGGIADGDFCGGYIIGNRDASGTPNHYGGMWAVANDIYGDMDLKFGADRESYETDTAQMILTADGNVGIGKTPTETLNLEVQAPTGYSVVSGFYSGSTQATATFRDANTTGQFKVRIGSEADDLLLFSGGFEKARIDSSGRLLIGQTTNTGDALLQVDGTARFQAQETDTSVYLSNTTNWVKVYERHYYAGSAFNYGAHNLLVAFAGATNGHGGACRIHIVTKQQGTSDNFDVQFVENVGEVNGQVAYRYDASGGDASGGLLSVWVRPTQIYMTVSVHSDVVGTVGKYDSGIILSSNTGSSTIPSGATEILPTMRLQTDGNVCIGKAGVSVSQAGFEFHDYGSAFASISGTTQNTWHYYNTTASQYRFYVKNNGGVVNFSANNVNLSDQRTKKDIVDSGDYLSKLCQIPVRNFRYNHEEDDGKHHLGVISQEVEAVAPEFVQKDAYSLDDETTRDAIYTSDLNFAMLKAIQEQQEIIESLKSRIEALEAN